MTDLNFTDCMHDTPTESGHIDRMLVCTPHAECFGAICARSLVRSNPDSTAREQAELREVIMSETDRQVLLEICEDEGIRLHTPNDAGDGEVMAL